MTLIVIISLIAFLLSLWIIAKAIYHRDSNYLWPLLPIVLVASLLLFGFSRENTSKEFQNNGKVEIEGLNYLYKGTLDGKVCIATESDSYNELHDDRDESFRDTPNFRKQYHKWNIIYCEEQGLGE